MLPVTSCFIRAFPLSACSVGQCSRRHEYWRKEEQLSWHPADRIAELVLDKTVFQA